MKRFVFNDIKSAAVAAVLIFAIATLTDASAGIVYLLFFVMISAYALFDARPDWLLRSPIGRWLRWRR